MQDLQNWSDLNASQKAEAVRGVYEAGDSANSIAEKVSGRMVDRITRNTVIGVYTRNKSLKEDCPLGPPMKARSQRSWLATLITPREPVSKKFSFGVDDSPFKKVPMPIPKKASIAYDVSRPGVLMWELSNEECIFPLPERTDRPGYLFCAEIVATGSRYCSHHKTRCTGL